MLAWEIEYIDEECISEDNKIYKYNSGTGMKIVIF